MKKLSTNLQAWKVSCLVTVSNYQAYLFLDHPRLASLTCAGDYSPMHFFTLFAQPQGAFYALRPEDLRRRPDVFVDVAASFCQ